MKNKKRINSLLDKIKSKPELLKTLNTGSNNNPIQDQTLDWRNLYLATEKAQAQQKLIWTILLFSLPLDLILLETFLANLVLNLLPHISFNYALLTLVLAVILSFQGSLVIGYQEALAWHKRTSPIKKLLILAAALLLTSSVFLYDLWQYLENLNLWGFFVAAIAIFGHFFGQKSDKTNSAIDPRIQQLKFLSQIILLPSYLARLASLLAVLALIASESLSVLEVMPYLLTALVIIIVSYPERSLLIAKCRICAQILPQSIIYKSICSNCRSNRPGV